jgi:hypothetical protein
LLLTRQDPKGFQNLWGLPTPHITQKRIITMKHNYLTFIAFCLTIWLLLSANTLSPPLYATPTATLTVTNLNDSGVGSLRQTLGTAGDGDTIVFNIPGGGTINLLSALPIITHPTGLTIDGSNGGQGAIIIDGGSTSNTTGDRIFFLGVKGSDNTGLPHTEAAVWHISNLTIRNGNARGGNGGSGPYAGGGAGAGMGGGIFLNAGELYLSNVSFINNRATGGQGGNLSGAEGSGGGGGGMGGNGGSPSITYNAGGGGGFGLGANGGGSLADGATGAFIDGSAAGAGAGTGGGTGGATGGGGGRSGSNQPAGGGGPSGAAGNSATDGSGGGGAGGFGGGGGGGGGNLSQLGGAGGYGGGGGSGPTGNGGAGGFGGGGGGGFFGGAAGFGGGSGANSYGGGGGGAGLGGSIFVRQGAELHITGGNFTGGSVAGGVGQNGGGSGVGVGTVLFLAGSASYTVPTGDTVTLGLGHTIGGGTDALISGGFTKSGDGTLILATDHNYTGPTAITGGTLTVNGSLLGSSTVTVGNGGRLNGTGSVSGSVAVQAGGELAPGASPGIFNSGSVTFATSSIFDVEIEGTTVGTGYDQLNVTGSVSLGNATLNVGGSHIPAVGDSFIIINNDGVDAVSGTFNGLPEGATLAVNGGYVTISYTAGDGNDVALVGVAACGVMNGGVYALGTPSVGIEVVDKGDIDCLTAVYVSGNHPAAPAGIQTGAYWEITAVDGFDNPVTNGFTVTLTIPTSFVPDADDKVCRYTGVGQVWDCAMSSFTSNSITRTGVNQFSVWAVGESVGPTAVSLATFSANPELTGLANLSALILLLLGASTAVSLRLRRHS